VSGIKILAVENDPKFAESLELIIRELGYELVGIVGNTLAALQLVQETTPDLVLIDIEISDSINGIELAGAITSATGIPIIYVTASHEKETFERAKLTLPKAYLVKPYHALSLQAAIELAIFNVPVQNATGLQPHAMGDTFYIKDSERLIKIHLRDIVLVEVDEKYCFINTAQKRYVVNMRLKDFLVKLPSEDFIQVHQYYVVRKSAIAEINIGDQTLRVREKTIPIGKNYKEQLLSTLNYLA